jgi:hypothetical protein
MCGVLSAGVPSTGQYLASGESSFWHIRQNGKAVTSALERARYGAGESSKLRQRGKAQSTHWPAPRLKS